MSLSNHNSQRQNFHKLYLSQLLHFEEVLFNFSLSPNLFISWSLNSDPLLLIKASSIFFLFCFKKTLLFFSLNEKMFASASFGFFFGLKLATAGLLLIYKCFSRVCLLLFVRRKSFFCGLNETHYSFSSFVEEVLYVSVFD